MHTSDALSRRYRYDIAMRFGRYIVCYTRKFIYVSNRAIHTSEIVSLDYTIAQRRRCDILSRHSCAYCALVRVLGGFRITRYRAEVRTVRLRINRVAEVPTIKSTGTFDIRARDSFSIRHDADVRLLSRTISLIRLSLFSQFGTPKTDRSDLICTKVACLNEKEEYRKFRSILQPAPLQLDLLLLSNLSCSRPNQRGCFKI